jgi:glycosyltransferase involved in cell wall biosynthesis
MADIIEKKPIVTVGICCYNREEGFKNTLKYITGQTYRNLEIIISQDFHPTLDLTGIVNAANDSRITFYRQPRQLYMYNNFRFLLEKATSDYFMWASDDDWWAPDFIEKTMHILLADGSAAAAHSDFYIADENNKKIIAYPNPFAYIQEFTETDDVKRLKRYINQFEAFGKPNLIYSIFLTSVLKTKQVSDILRICDLSGDMLVLLSVLTHGHLVIYPEVLRTATADNQKSYSLEENQSKRFNLFVMYLNIGGVKYMYNKWNPFINDHFKIIWGSELPLLKKIALLPTLVKKKLFFYYDVICCNVQLRGYDIFSKIRRTHYLN